MKFIVYSDLDGRILRVGECVDALFDSQSLSGESVIEGEANDEEEYILAGVITPRPEITAIWNKTAISADGADTATFGSTLPNPTDISVMVPDGAISPEVETVTSGTFEFATPIVGEYTLSIVPPFPYQPISQVITAV